MRIVVILSLMALAACAARQRIPATRSPTPLVTHPSDVLWQRQGLVATATNPAGFASVERSPFEVALQIPGPRDGYLVRIDPAAVPANIERMYVERQWAGGYPLPDDGACLWTREHPVCAFSAPAGWGLGFVVAARPWWIPPAPGERGYAFYTGDIAVSLNGEPAEVYTVFEGGPNNLRIYGVRGREISISRNESVFRGAQPMPSFEEAGWESLARP